MTVVIALVHPGGVVLGSDSLVSGTRTQWVENEPKYFHVPPDMVIGYAGSCRACLVAETLPRLRRPKRGERDLLYVQHVVAEALRQAHKAAEVDDGHFSAVVVWRGRAYLCDGYEVTIPAHGLVTIGSGGDVALGALAATPELPPRARVERAIAVASEHCVGVGGPSHVIDLTFRPPRRAA